MAPSKWILEQVVFGGVIHLEEGLTTIGRNVRSTIVASSDYVSRNHAQIHISPDSQDIRIIDLGSKNGIYVNEFQYCNVDCALNAGDRIGIGVEVDDIMVANFPEGKYPIYLLKCLPEKPTNEAPAESMNEVVQQTIQPNNKDENDDSVINGTDNEEDVMKEKQDAIQAQPSSEKEALVTVKNEPEPIASSSRAVCRNIKTIFGVLNQEILNNLSEETRKMAELSTNMKDPEISKDIICISSSEDEDCDQRNTNCPTNKINPIKHSNDVLISTNNIKQANNTHQGNNIQLENPENISTSEKPKDSPPHKPSTSTDLKKTIENNLPASATEIEKQSEKNVTSEDVNRISENNQPLNEPNLNCIKDEFDDEEDDNFFTQRIFEDMKDYAADLLSEENCDVKSEHEDADSMSIKQEIFPQNLDGTIINLDDEDDFDDDLDSKTLDWSMKLTKSSQSFSNSFNLSQIYEDNYSDQEEVAPKTRAIFLDDNDDVMDFVDRAAMVEVKTDELKSSEKDVRNQKETHFFSSEDEVEDENNREDPSTSLLSLKKFHEKVIRRLSTSEDVPTKKRRFSSKHEDSEEEQVRRSSSSSSHRTYSRKSSHAKEDNSAKDDVFEKLKENYKPKSKPKLASHQKSIEDKQSKDKNSTSGTEAPTSKVYKSATIARRKSIGRNSLNDQNDVDDFEVKTCQAEPVKVNVENKKPEPQVTAPTVTKIIRGPPEIIQPPTLPTHKGKLRGISATHERMTEKLKATSNTNDLKRKWLEKPSAKADKEKEKAIKEKRKKKLKELNDRKQSESVNSTSKKVSTKRTTADEEESSKTKVKVKVTQSNRGAFLTEIPSTTPRLQYTIPKKKFKPSGSSPKVANRSTSRISPSKLVQKTNPQQPKPNTEIITNFAMELAQADAVHQKQAIRERAKSTDTTNEQKQCAPPRPSTKKVNFNSMKQALEEKDRMLASISDKKRKVTFKLPPEIRYFESEWNLKPKRLQKESTKFLERRAIIRKQYALMDKTDSLLDDILSWSQLWLRNKDHNLNMMVFPMTNSFKSFSEYKSIILPLLKMEFIAHLEKATEQISSKPKILAEIDYSTPHKHRDYLFAKCNTLIKPTELSFNDLALIDICFGTTASQHVGYISNIRRSGTCSCITIEITPNSIHKEVLQTKPKIKIRRIMDGILLHLSSFNAVHQLKETPLIQNILNPIELLNNQNNYRTLSIEYKGFNTLNKEQLDILLKTYERAIDESNPTISLINGPPGTGKSVLISNLAMQFLYGNEVNELDKKILICAQSNMAVDVIAEKLIKIKQKLSPDTTQFNVVRFGMDEKVHPDVRGITLKSILQRHRMNILRRQSNQAINEENLKLEIIQLETNISEMEKHNFQDVRQEELIEMRKNLALKKNILNQAFRPEDEKRLQKWYLENANIVCSTLSSCVKLATFVDYFDVCIIDEATQCTEPWALLPLRFGVSSLIMVGDTQQLPATVISQRAKELGLETSLFTRIKKCLENDYRETPQILKIIETKPIFTLNEQYRMNSEISKWPNMYFYKNQLRNNPKTDEFKSSIRPFSILNLEYEQNDSYHGQISISNNLEAEFVAKLVTALDNYIPNKFYSYGVITPYAHHREKLENMIINSGLKNIMVNTIDSYQGIEKDVIIISNARTHGVGFLANYQRLNVALTRPRKCLIVCGNFKNLESVPSWASLLANAKERGLYHNISPQDALDITKNVIEKIKIKR